MALAARASRSSVMERHFPVRESAWPEASVRHKFAARSGGTACSANMGRNQGIHLAAFSDLRNASDIAVCTAPGEIANMAIPYCLVSTANNSVILLNAALLTM